MCCMRVVTARTKSNIAFTARSGSPCRALRAWSASPRGDCSSRAPAGPPHRPLLTARTIAALVHWCAVTACWCSRRCGAAAANRLCSRHCPRPQFCALHEFGHGVLPQLTIDEVVYNIDMAQSFRGGGQGVVYLCR